MPSTIKQQPIVPVAPGLAPAESSPADGVEFDAVIADWLLAIMIGEVTAGAPFALGCYEVPGRNNFQSSP